MTTNILGVSNVAIANLPQANLPSASLPSTTNPNSPFIPPDVSGLVAWYNASSLVSAPIDPSTLSNLVGHYRADSLITPPIAPSSLSGLQGYYRADLGITQVAGSVSNWADQSGNGNDLSQSNPLFQPTYSASDSNINNKPSINFTAAANGWMNTGTWSDAPVAQPITMIVIGYGQDTAANRYFIDSLDGTNQMAIIAHGGDGVLGYSSAGGFIGGTTWTEAPTPSIMIVQFDSTTSIGVNTNAPKTTTGYTNTTTINGITVGNYAGHGSFSGVTIAEVAVLNRKLTNAEYLGIMSYGSSRYSIPLSIGAWNDTSGVSDSTHNLIQATFGNMPVLKSIDSAYGNKPSLAFTAANSTYMDTAFFTSAITQPYSVIVIGESTTTTGSNQYFGDGLSQDSGSFLPDDAGTGTSVMYAGSVLQGASTVRVPQIMGGVFNTTNSSIYNTSTTPFASAQAVGSQSISGLTVGAAAQGSGGFLQGKIAEYIIINGAISQATMAGIQTYAAQRYGIGLKVAIWNDTSGVNDSTHNLAQSTYASQPTLNLSDNSGYNGQPTVSFASAASQYLQSTTWSTAITAPRTVLIVGNYDGAATLQFMLDGLSVNVSAIENNGASNNIVINSGSGIGTVSPITSTPMIIVGVFGSSGAIYISAKTFATSGNTGTASLTGLNMGTAGNVSAYLNGKIAEAIIYNKVLSSIEINELLVELGNKYNITIGA